MTRQDLIDFCLTLSGSYEDYPFDDDSGVWTAMRHRGNRKIFALIFERGGRLCVNVKCDPDEADLLRGQYQDVTPGYHMNKVHWNTVVVGGDVPAEDVRQMIIASHDLIRPRAPVRSAGAGTA